jgi:hypothetical protein
MGVFSGRCMIITEESTDMRGIYASYLIEAFGRIWILQSCILELHHYTYMAYRQECHIFNNNQ